MDVRINAVIVDVLCARTGLSDTHKGVSTWPQCSGFYALSGVFSKHTIAHTVLFACRYFKKKWCLLLAGVKRIVNIRRSHSVT
jgi:hypothetical protein